jgi:uncharacterized heparinase superfamily protein
VEWDARDSSRLWRFHLHYFDDAPALALAGCLTGETRYVDLFRGLAADWIARNPVGVGDGWHPYTISRRIPNWIYALTLTGLATDGEASPMIASLYKQARFLIDNLEFDALGNHLIANIRALLFAGAFFAGEEARRWWVTGERLLQREIAEQFLADGGHFERSPMYHTLVLQDLLECAALFRHGTGIPVWLREAICRATVWLSHMIHPDGGVALFNDATLEGPSYPEMAAFTRGLIGSQPAGAAIGWRQWVWCGRAAECPDLPCDGSTPSRTGGEPAPSATLTAMPESGYFVLRDLAAGHALFFDAAELCPTYIPAHAHADLLSFELSLFGRRVIVDSGVCEYANGPWRDYCRSTRAHNTLQVDGQDQAEIWGSFRLGRRARPTALRWSASSGQVEVSATHTVYRRLKGEVSHRRRILYDGSCYHVSDEVTGAGIHRVESFLHFHPDLTVRLETSGVVAEGQGVRLDVRFHGVAHAQLQQGTDGISAPLQGWYCPEFGRRRPNPVLVLTWDGALPARLGYVIQPRGIL